jgi:hypothetical protein
MPGNRVTGQKPVFPDQNTPVTALRWSFFVWGNPPVNAGTGIQAARDIK